MKEIKDLRKKIIGCWQGKAIGGTLGGPVEGKEGPLSLSFYDPLPDKMMPNDDLDLQLVWLRTLQDTGFPVSCRSLADAWMDRVRFYPDEYGICLRNMATGLYPPLSGSYDNFFHDGMGAAIRTEIWACLAPGNPERAVALAQHDACVDHTADGLFAAKFIVAIEALAFVESDVSVLLEKGLSFIPESCRIHRAVSNTIRWWSELQDVLAVRKLILDAYNEENWTDVAPNVAFITLGWLAGKGDFGASICIAANCGNDTDCTAATLGSILGILNPDSIPQKWKDPIGNNVVLSPGIVDLPVPENIEALTDAILALQPSVTEPAELPEECNGSRLSILSETPLGVRLEYAEHVAFAPGEKTACRLFVKNPGTETMEVRLELLPPPDWEVSFSDGLRLRTFTLAPRQSAEEPLFITAPAKRGTRFYRNPLSLRFTLPQGLRWSVSAGLPQTYPWSLNGESRDLPDHSVPLSAETETCAEILFKTAVEDIYSILFAAPTRVRLFVDGALLADDTSCGTVPAVHRCTGCHAEKSLSSGWHHLRVVADPVSGKKREATFCIGNRRTWQAIPDVEFAPADVSQP